MKKNIVNGILNLYTVPLLCKCLGMTLSRLKTVFQALNISFFGSVCNIIMDVRFLEHPRLRLHILSL